METYENKIFISYAWGGESENIVNEIDQSLQRRGITIIRDKRDLGYKGSIKEFMGQIGRGNCVIVVVSDKYLKSPNCMFELVEISENKLFNDRIFPVVLPDANIYDPINRIAYVKHWELKREELAGAIRQVDPANLQGIYDDMNNYDRFRSRISELATILKDMNTLTLEIHQDTDFDNLYASIEKRMKSEETKEADTTTSNTENTSATISTTLSSTYSFQVDIPEGTMDPDSKFYIERPEDKIVLEILKEKGYTVIIKGPRQVGKSSLLTRAIKSEKDSEKKIAFLDFQLVESANITNQGAFFRTFCSWISDEIGIVDKSEDYWKSELGSALCCTRYINNYVLPMCSNGLLIAIDESERIFESPFRSDFFGMLRSWHNKRRTNSVWKNLSLILVTSTEPNMFITNIYQSPFNVGRTIAVSDFTLEHLQNLNKLYSFPLTTEQINRLMILLGGQPYLTHLLINLVASGESTFEYLEENACSESGVFINHLQKHLLRLQNRKDLTFAFEQIINSGFCSDEISFIRLFSAGLVVRKSDKFVPRCELYSRFFKERLNAG